MKAPSDTVEAQSEITRRETIPSATSGSFITTGANASYSKLAAQPGRASVPDVHIHVTEGESGQLCAGQDITESMESIKISSHKVNPPHTLQREYFHSNEYDLDGEKMDTKRFLFHDDASYEGESTAAPTFHGFGADDRDVGSDRARGNYNPGDASRAACRTLGEGDIGVGYGGVEYYLTGQGGILPGYPTEEGVKKLLSERMKDDRLRAAGGVFSTLHEIVIG